MQKMCENHLSANSSTTSHVTRIDLKHCYGLTDNGIQWLVGSCHSTKITRLDLSSTGLTGNCFLRKLPHLSFLALECCPSLNGQGLQNVAKTCPHLIHFSVSLNKQLDDNDLEMAFKSGLAQLKIFQACYTNINGSCFKHFQSLELKKLVMHSCPKLKDEGLKMYLNRCKCLLFLDVSVSAIDGSCFGAIGSHLPSLKYLYLDYCQHLKPFVHFAHLPNLKYLSLFKASQINLANNNGKLNVFRQLENGDCERAFCTRRGLKFNKGFF